MNDFQRDHMEIAESYAKGTDFTAEELVRRYDQFCRGEHERLQEWPPFTDWAEAVMGLKCRRAE